MGKKWWSRFEKTKGYIVFPIAIAWVDRDPLFVKHTSIFSIHFLWWSWGLWFERGGT